MFHISRQIVSGKLRQETSAGLHSTGPAVVFAGLMKGSMRFISGVEKARRKYGKPRFEKSYSADWGSVYILQKIYSSESYDSAQVNEIQ